MINRLVLILVCCSIGSSFTIHSQTEVASSSIQQLQGIPWPFTSCGDSDDWTIQSVTLSQTPKRNINDDIDIAGTTKKAISFLRVEINVKLNGAFLDKQVIPFTSQYDEGDAVEFRYKNYVPSFAPSGNCNFSTLKILLMDVFNSNLRSDDEQNLIIQINRNNGKQKENYHKIREKSGVWRIKANQRDISE